MGWSKEKRMEKLERESHSYIYIYTIFPEKLLWHAAKFLITSRGYPFRSTWGSGTGHSRLGGAGDLDLETYLIQIDDKVEMYKRSVSHVFGIKLALAASASNLTFFALLCLAGCVS